jgi:tetratricopeptide (TPR) repeat protein
MYLSYKVLRSIDYSQVNADGVLRLKVGTKGMKWISDLNTGCQILWKSRIIASIDLNEARKVFDNDTECAQNALYRGIYYEWRGQLEWLLGNPQNARDFWEQLSVLQLWRMGKGYLLSKNLDQAEAIFGIILERPDLGLRKIDLIPLFADLANLYQQKGNWEKTAKYYRVAWENDGESYGYSYLLGNAYWNLKQCAEAIPVFEAGLKDQRHTNHTETDFFYHAFLGACYASLGKNEAAQKNYSIAQHILEENKDRSPREFIESQRRWLKSLQDAINTEIEP